MCVLSPMSRIAQFSSVFATMCARLAGVRGVIASRRSWHSPHLQGRILRANRFAYRFADRVVGNSPSVSSLVESEGGVPASRIVTIPNFLDPQSFEPLSETSRRALLDELGVPADAFVVGIVARLSAVKDHATLLRALVELAKEIPNVHSVLVGEGPERGRIEALARELGIEDRVHLAGERPQIPNLHGLFDVSVLCSTTEAAGRRTRCGRARRGCWCRPARRRDWRARSRGSMRNRHCERSSAWPPAARHSPDTAHPR